MDNEIYENYKSAGRIAAAARNYGMKLIKVNAKYYDVASAVENKIIEMGAHLAFPVNISVNEVAAHFTPKHDDESVFKKDDVVKLDVGAHVNGYIADTAVTVEVETHKYDEMIQSVRHALNNAIEMMKADVALGDIGSVIEKTIQSGGYSVVDNLTGHSLKQYVLHAGLSIPNISGAVMERDRPRVGDVIAIEPFATDGAGHVVPGDGSNIYRYVGKPRFLRDFKTIQMLNSIGKKFNTLPFAERWCTDFTSDTDLMMKKLVHRRCIKQYSQLLDAEKGIVAQAEHTVIIHEDGCEITT